LKTIKIIVEVKKTDVIYERIYIHIYTITRVTIRIDMKVLV